MGFRASSADPSRRPCPSQAEAAGFLRGALQVIMKTRSSMCLAASAVGSVADKSPARHRCLRVGVVRTVDIVHDEMLYAAPRARHGEHVRGAASAMAPVPAPVVRRPPTGKELSVVARTFLDYLKLGKSAYAGAESS